MRASTVGLGLGLLSAAALGTTGSFGTSLLDANWSPAALTIARSTIAALLLSIPALLQLRGRWAMLRRGAGTIFCYGAFAIGATPLLFFNAVDYMPVGVTLLVMYSGALVLVVVWLWLRHGHRPSPLTAAGSVVALSGLGLVLDLTGPQAVNIAGVLWALAAGTGLALYFIISSDATSPVPAVAMAWAGLVVGAVTVGAAVLVGVVPLRMSTAPVEFRDHAASWTVPLAGLALLGAAFAYAAGIEAARRLGARRASFLGLSEVPFAVLFAWALLGEGPTVLQAVGSIIALLGICLVKAGETHAPLLGLSNPA